LRPSPRSHTFDRAVDGCYVSCTACNCRRRPLNAP